MSPIPEYVFKLLNHLLNGGNTMSDYDNNGNRITPYRSVHTSRNDRNRLANTGSNRHQYRDNNSFYHLR